MLIEVNEFKTENEVFWGVMMGVNDFIRTAAIEHFEGDKCVGVLGKVFRAAAAMYNVEDPLTFDVLNWVVDCVEDFKAKVAPDLVLVSYHMGQKGLCLSFCSFEQPDLMRVN